MGVEEFCVYCSILITFKFLLELAAYDEFDAFIQYYLNLMGGAMKAAFDSNSDTHRIQAKI